MFEINWDYNIHIDGIIDTGIIVIAHFENPIQENMLMLLKDIFNGNKRILIPLTTFVGAYHILTSYLKVNHLDAKIALTETLKIDSNYFFPLVSQKIIIEGIDIASVYKIESWDGYLVALARLFQTSNIYSVDKKLRKKTDLNIIYPVTDEELAYYHQFLQKSIFQ